MNFLTRLTLIIIAFTFCAAQGFSQDAKGNKETGAPVESPPPPAVEYNPNSWKEFYDERGRFSIMFPGTPVEADNSSDDIVGRKFTLKTSAYYFVGYQDFPASVADLEKEATLRKQFFERLRDQVMSLSHARVLSETEATIDGHPGSFTKFEVPNGSILRQYIYVVGKRTYQLFVVTPKELSAPDGGKFDETRATKFLTTFRLAGPKNNDGTKP